jgi:hypothetical protein
VTSREGDLADGAAFAEELIPVAISSNLTVPVFAAQFGLRTTRRTEVSFYANGYQTGLPDVRRVMIG